MFSNLHPSELPLWSIAVFSITGKEVFCHNRNYCEYWPGGWSNQTRISRIGSISQSLTSVGFIHRSVPLILNSILKLLGLATNWG